MSESFLFPDQDEMLSDSDERAERGDTKSAAAFRTISEVSEELAVPQHVLRFWETKFSQVRPLKRAGGRRYYRPEDVALLRRVHRLLYLEGYTIKGVQKLLREGAGKAEPAEPETAPAATSEAAVVASVGDGVGAANRQALRGLLDELIAVRSLIASAEG